MEEDPGLSKVASAFYPGQYWSFRPKTGDARSYLAAAAKVKWVDYMSCGIYKITNKINGKCYIGQSIHIEKRWTKEKFVSRDPKSSSYNTMLSKAFREYGPENFNFEIVEECPVELLNEKEIYYIDYYDSYFNGYNSTTGGQNGQGAPSKISKEQLLEIYDLLQNSDTPQGEIAKKYRVGEDVISTINQGKSRRLPGYTYPLREREKNTYYCIDCGKEIVRNAVGTCYCRLNGTL